MGIYKAGNLGAKKVETINSGCAVCVWQVGVASAVGMQELDRVLQEYIAANAEKIRELGFMTPTLKISEWRCAEFEVQCHGQVAQTAGGWMQSCRCAHSDRVAAREPRWFVR